MRTTWRTVKNESMKMKELMTLKRSRLPFMSQNMMKLLVKLSNHINDKCFIINYGIFVEKYILTIL